MDPTTALQSEFPATTPDQVAFKKLRDETLAALSRREVIPARERLIACCDFCLEKETAEFDPELEMLQTLCCILETEQFGDDAAREALMSGICDLLAQELDADSLADECFAQLSEGNLLQAKVIRHLVPANHESVEELDEIIQTAEAVLKAHAKRPEQTEALVAEAALSQASAFDELMKSRLPQG